MPLYCPPPWRSRTSEDGSPSPSIISGFSDTQNELLKRTAAIEFASSPTWSLGCRRSQDTGEYEMSVVHSSRASSFDCEPIQAIPKTTLTKPSVGLSDSAKHKSSRTGHLLDKPPSSATSGSSKAGSASGNKTKRRRPQPQPQSQPEWSPWRRNTRVRTADTIDPMVITFRGVGGASMRR